MADKKFIIRGGQKVTIEISPKSKVQNPKFRDPFRRGAIKLRKENPYLARRLNNQGIRFFDLSQFLVGGLPTDISFSVPVNFVGNSDGTHNVDVPVLADYRALETQIIDSSVETLETRFWQIDQAAGRILSVKVFTSAGGLIHNSADTGDAFWTGGKARLQAEELTADGFRLVFPLSYELELSGAGRDIITSVYDPDAEEVAFTPGKNDIYFLMPFIGIHHGSTESNTTPTSGEQLYSDSKPFARRPLLDSESEFNGMPVTSLTWNAGGSAPDYATVHKLTDYILATGVNLVAKNRAFNTGTFNWDWTDISDPEDFPRSDIYPSPPGSAGSEAFSFGVALTTTSVPAKVLMAVIKQGSQLFYVWKRNAG